MFNAEITVSVLYLYFGIYTASSNNINSLPFNPQTTGLGN